MRLQTKNIQDNYVNQGYIGYIRGGAYYGAENASLDNLYVGKTAKSLAYLQNKDEKKGDVAYYDLAANDEAATFRATLIYDGETATKNADAVFVFAPYAVVKGETGNYAVIGTVNDNVTLNAVNP